MFNYKLKLRNFLGNVIKDANQIKWNKEISSEQIYYTLSMQDLFLKTKDIPGHIIELGSGYGRNSIIFGSLIQKYSKDKIKHYFGFDAFEYNEEDLKFNKNLNIDHFKYNQNSHQEIQDKVKRNKLDDVVTLIKGDFKDTIKNFLNEDSKFFQKEKPLFSLIYVDCNSYHATKFSLNALKDYIIDGAYIAIDETKQGDESKALIEFARENDQQILSGDFGYQSHISSFIRWKSL